MSKFTPGPWEYDQDENEIHAVDFQDKGGDPYHVTAMLSTNPANRSLICTAPEMYDMLKSARYSIVHLAESSKYLDDKSDALLELAKIDKVLAKARGES